MAGSVTEQTARYCSSFLDIIEKICYNYLDRIMQFDSVCGKGGVYEH